MDVKNFGQKAFSLADSFGQTAVYCAIASAVVGTLGLISACVAQACQHRVDRVRSINR